LQVEGEVERGGVGVGRDSKARFSATEVSP